MVYVIQFCCELAACWQLASSNLSANLYDILPLLCVQWKTPHDWQRNCPKHVECYSKNKFEKLVHLVGFIMRMIRYFVEKLHCSSFSVYIIIGELLGGFSKRRNILGPLRLHSFERIYASLNYIWLNQLSNTTNLWWIDAYYIVINYMFRRLWPSSGWWVNKKHT